MSLATGKNKDSLMNHLIYLVRTYQHKLSILFRLPGG